MYDEVIPGGKRRRVLLLVSSSMAGRVLFRAAPTDGAPPAGKVEVRGGMFGTRREEHPLVYDNNLRKRFTDNIYSVWVTPERQTRITFKTRHFRAHLLAIALVLLIVAGVTAALLPRLLAG